MKKIKINEGKANKLFNINESNNNESNMDFDDNILISNETFPEPIFDDSDDSDDDETEFYDELNNLIKDGIHTFKLIGELLEDHPYAINNSEKVKKYLDKINAISENIEEFYD